ncbi:hypothetical protein [Vibrio sp. SCSIO 43136]|uniref:hypothetical protein n=1 Tax=Vibrio sp. SCSIO 43136 TaxID=2819101 RepID=UPI00207635DD|nr:hypothetical protein [Vibrio sp. SCSIO 43136]USD66142.1 hypothetical protein J4N39_04835 [Vibrio sp. SCSIO 43136]
MRYLHINQTKVISGICTSETKIPILVISLFGKYAPDYIYRFILGRLTGDTFDDPEEFQFMKGFTQTIIKVIKDSAHDEQLAMYDGVIAEFVEDDTQVKISIV